MRAKSASPKRFGSTIGPTANSELGDIWLTSAISISSLCIFVVKS